MTKYYPDEGWIIINDEYLRVEKIHNYGWTMLELEDKTEWYFFEDHDAAGEAAREYWADMAENDPSEFACIVGEQTLIAWALNQSAGPGSVQVHNLEEWLDLWLNTPEEQWASYDGEEIEGVCLSPRLCESLGVDYDKSAANTWVVYRHN